MVLESLNADGRLFLSISDGSRIFWLGQIQATSVTVDYMVNIYIQRELMD